MHVDNKSNKLITQTLYSRLENATVRDIMIKMVKDDEFDINAFLFVQIITTFAFDRLR